MKQAKNIILLLLLLILSALYGYAQFKPTTQMTPDEKELFKHSLDAFKEEEFIVSLQGFSQLLSLYPREPVFNFVYGASMINLSTDIKKSFDYLKFAVGKGIPEANFYIGLGYQYLYDFENAIVYYDEFKRATKSKIWKEYDIDKYIGQANSGKDLIRYAYELKVISNRQTLRDNFYYSYELKDFGGEIIVKTDEFKGKADKRIDQSDLMYISNSNGIVLLSSYGDSKKNSLDIYISYKNSTGWSKPHLLSETINSIYDEAYPFITDDGKTLYFSSKGHNSIGGYDIFKSHYNKANNSWSPPENLDFPINTPFDDIMYSLDRYGETAFFASTRESKSGQIGVYRILLEQEPISRQIVSIDDVYKHASLIIKPTALEELTKRQEVRAISMIDTSQYRTEIIASVDTANNSNDINLDKSYKLLDEKKSIAQMFFEYASCTYEICQINLTDIKSINKDITSLRNNRNTESKILIDSLTQVLIDKSNIAIEMFDLANFYYNKANQLITLSNYYENELDILSGLSRTEKKLSEQIVRISREIENIDANSPVEAYNKKLLSERNLKSKKLDTYSTRLIDGFDKLNVINEKINLKLELAKKEPEFTIREKYVYDIKSLENKKIDLIAEIKENEVQIEFIEYEIQQMDNRKQIIDSNLVGIEDGLVYNPELKINESNNEIDLLKTYISQNSLKELAHKQDKILSDTRYYSKELNLDAILYADHELISAGLDDLLIDTKLYTDKYEDILSENTLKTGNLISKNDSVKDIIKNLEIKFDSVDDLSEKQAIISEINEFKAEINKNNDDITSYLDSQTPIDINKYIPVFENFKNTYTGVEKQIDLQETHRLIGESQKLANDISDLKILGANEDNPPILYLEGMKSEIDNLIIQKIENLKLSDLVADNTTNQEVLNNLDLRLNEITEAYGAQEIQEITNKFRDVATLYTQAENEENAVERNKFITEANEILDSTITQNIDFINQKLFDNYQKLDIYSNLFEKLPIKSKNAIEQVDNIIKLQLEATDLQLLAEETENKREKMLKLSDAWINLELVNQYYDYAFEITRDEKSYRKNYEIEMDKEIESLYAYSTSIIRQEPTVEEVIYNTDIAYNSEPITDNLLPITDFTDNTELITDNLLPIIDFTDTTELITDNLLPITDFTDSTELIIDNLLPITDFTDTTELITDTTELITDNLLPITDFTDNTELITDNLLPIIDFTDTTELITDNLLPITDFTDNTELITDNLLPIIDFTDTTELITDNLLPITDFTDNTELITDNLLPIIDFTDTTELITDNLLPITDFTDTTELITDSTELITDNLLPITDFTDNTALLQKLDSVSYGGQIRINITQQTKQKQEIDELLANIDKIQINIANTNSKTRLENLNTELRQTQEEQIRKLVAYSKTTNEMMLELGNINRYNVFSSGNDLLESLLARQNELRISIIDYSNFYTAEELNQKHLEAISLEDRVFKIYNTAILDTENDVLAANIKNANSTEFVANSTSTDTIQTNDFANKGNYKYDYDYDNKTLVEFNKLENNISIIESKIQIHEINIAEIESSMQFSNSSSDYKKFQKELEKENKKYLKQLKLWAGYSKDYLSLKNDLGDDYYYNSISATNKIVSVSDSLKSESESKFTESIALFEVIITYKAKMADSQILESYKKADILSIEAVNMLNAANYLKSEGLETDPLVVAHYRTTETSDQTDLDIREIPEQSDIVNLALLDDNIDIKDNIQMNDSVHKSDNLAVIDNTINNDEIVLDNAKNNSKDFVDTNLENLFDAGAGSFYSDANPITNIPNVEGLFYRIQIAAFNGKVENDLIKGIRPIFWEAVPNSILVRYIVGNFYKYNDVRNTLPNVQAMGYADAFIVAYYNGQRITVYEARRIEEREAQNQFEIEVLFADNNNQESKNIKNVIINNQDNNDIEDEKNNLVDNSETQNLAETSGVFFCIQIGVYASQIGSDRLYGLEPIMYHNYTGNLVRHTFGRYYDINTAINEQNKIRRLGIKDAFVVAYRDGKKISLNEARNLLANMETPQVEITLNIPDNQIPVNPQLEQLEPPVVDNDVLAPEENSDLNTAPIVEYYIQIGVFRNDVNIFIRDSFRRIAGSNQLVRLTNSDLTLYRIGIFNNYKSAQSELNNVIAAGIKDAFIVAYVNGKRIDIARARILK